MALRKKKKIPNKTKKRLARNQKKNALIKKKVAPFSIDSKNILKFFMMLLKAPFLLINLIVKNTTFLIGNIFFHIWQFIKNILNLLGGFKEGVFGIIFGLLSGGIGAVIIFSYLDVSSDTQFVENKANFVANLEKINNLELELEQTKNELSNYQSYISKINKKLEELFTTSENNIESFSENEMQIQDLLDKTSSTDQQLQNLEKKITETTKLMLSSSKSELSNRLYLAQSLVDRLKSGVPYAPQLIALGREGLDPSLLRFAKGGAPTIDALTARLSVRAGELRDAHKTKSDDTWKNNLKDEISKFVKIKPKNSSDIQGMEGVLLRAEEAISRGNLSKAILEIDSLAPSDRGVLDSWLKEAKAKQNASLAAENLLAKTTAALRKRN